jgi:small-conductance mechanosensitive channel
MSSSHVKWSVGSLMLLLPLIVGFIADHLERLPEISSRGSSRIALLVFGASVLLAAVIPAGFIVTAPTTALRRLGFTVAVWCLLFLEVIIVFGWSFRGIH